MTATLEGQNPPIFQAKLHAAQGERITIRTTEEAQHILQDLEGASFVVSHIDQKEKRAQPLRSLRNKSSSTRQREKAAVRR